MGTDLTTSHQYFDQLASRLSNIYIATESDSESAGNDSHFRESWNGIFEKDLAILRAGVLIGGDDGVLMHLYDYNSTRLGAENDFDIEMQTSVAGQQWLKFRMSQEAATLSPVFYRTGHVANYHPFQLGEDLPALLVILSDHDFLISNRSSLQYAILLLFLVSSLFSLLTVYLISNRFREPLARLQLGLEKTAQGELYHMMEPDGDIELRNLAETFNRMTRKLLGSNRSLQKFSVELAESNRQGYESQSYFAALIDNSPDSIISSTPDGQIVIFNHQAQKAFDYHHEEILGRNVSELFTESGGENLASHISANKDFEMEMLGRRKDGTIFPAYMVVTHLYDEEKRIMAHLFIVRDISESKNFQEMMIRIDRYYNRGEMAGDIAHEINNYLAVLSGNLELMPLLLKKGDTEKIDHKLEVMKATVDKIGRFANGLMDPNQGEAYFEMADMNQLIENMIAFLKPQNRFKNIELSADLAVNLPLIELDVGQIQQLLVNLVYNAADALKDSERPPQVVISTSLLDLSPDPRIRLEVRDNGHGVPEEYREKLFQKRFTTKRKGHGIGLVTCQKIVEAHRGRIGCDNLDKGAVFYVEMAARRPAEDQAHGQPMSTVLTPKV